MVIKTDELPLPGETRLGGTFFMHAGGKGANQAVAAARLGASVTLVTKLGDDIFGKQALENFNNEKIQTTYVYTDVTVPSGTALIMVNREGENCISVAPGANEKLQPADIENVKELSQAALILMQLEIPLETITHVAKMVRANQQKLILNPAPAQKLPEDLLSGLFLITPNETEAFALTGIHVTDEKTASEAAAIFLHRGVQNIIITMGRLGAFFQNGDFNLKVDAPRVDAVDTTAAGDVFNGAIAVAITEKMNWETAMRFAIQSASLSVTRMGAQSSAPYRKEIII
jgi:ribokinase